jgi:outer membrane protein TolC
VIGAALLVLSSAPAGAQAGPLEAYIEEAVRSNLGLRQERLAAERSAAAVGEARSGFLPSLSLSARHSEATGVLNLGDLVNPAYRALNQLTGSGAFPTDVDAQLPFRQETAVRLAQPLFNPGIAEQYRLARRAESLQREQLAAATRRLAADVQTAYLNHARASRVVDLYRNTLPLLDESLRVAERLLAAGRVTPDALFRARAERSEVEQQLAEAEGRRDDAQQSFNLLLDRPLDRPLDLLPDSVLVPGAHLSLDEALTRARAGREELRQADHGIAMAEGQRRLARAAFLPTVAVALDYGIQGSDYRWTRDTDFAVASLVLQWNAFSGGRDAARSRQATLERDRARARRVEAERGIELQVATAHRAAGVARGALDTAEDRLLAARRTFELVSRRYEEGMAAQIEFLDARVAYTNAELNRILTHYEYAVRWVELERVAALR